MMNHTAAVVASRTSSLLLAKATTAVSTNSRMLMTSQRFLSWSSSLRFMQQLPKAAAVMTSSSVVALSSSFPMNHHHGTLSVLTTTRRFLSSKKEDDNDGSHSDFAAQRKKTVTGGEDEALRLIAEHVRDNTVMLYMKGSPSAPMCGFSAKVVAALKENDIDFASVNVLDYPSIRDGVKKFSDWPTIPQLYVSGEFIGGCDIVMSMQESGELKELLQNAVAATKAKE